ncbi:MAG: ArnT family glycosyltransferase, partial [Acidobacteriota bacterium]
MSCTIHQPAAAGFQESTAERRALFLLFGATFLLRLVFAFHYSFDSDEPQHLHVIWGWTSGLLQYRDVFDNHTPLFHLLFSPLLSLWGESADVLYVMRLSMIPLFAAALWITHAIGKELFSQRVGVWAALLAGLFPAFFLCSVEFRTDNLWTVFWLLAVICTIKANLTPARALL